MYWVEQNGAWQIISGEDEGSAEQGGFISGVMLACCEKPIKGISVIRQTFLVSL